MSCRSCCHSIKMRAVAGFMACLAVAVAVPNHQRIVGGDIASIEEYPFAAALVFSYEATYFRFHCGGTIITQRLILTSAACIKNSEAYQWRARVGSTSKSSGGLMYEVLSLTVHPEYNDRTSYDYNVGLVRTTASIAVNGRTIAAGRIAGPNYIPADNAPVWAIGWGRLGGSGPNTDVLHHVELRVVNQQTCKDRYAERNMNVTENMICAGWLDVGGRDFCGDFGSPILHDGVVVGIISFDVGDFVNCALPYFPGVSTRVSRFATWITSYA